jgi:hypothetical protein
MAEDAPGMRGERGRNENGELRDKRNDTHMGTIEQRYNRDFRVRSDMQLGTFLKQTGFVSLHELLKSDIGLNWGQKGASRSAKNTLWQKK